MTLIDAPAPCASAVWAREADHRIANNLMLVAAMVRLHARTVAANPSMTGAEVAAFLRSVTTRIDAVGRLHRMLSSDCAAVDCAAYLEEVCQLTAASAQDEGALELDLDLDPRCTPPIEQFGALALFASEALVNAVKHAHPADAPGRVRVVLRRIGRAFRLEITDDGVGLPADFDRERGGGLGFDIMRALAAQLRGRFDCHSSDLGCTVRVTFPAQF